MLTATSEWIYENRRQCIVGALCGLASCGLLIEFGPSQHLGLILGTSVGVFGVIQGGGFLYAYRSGRSKRPVFGTLHKELMGILGVVFVVVGFIMAVKGLAELAWLAALDLLGGEATL